MKSIPIRLVTEQLATSGTYLLIYPPLVKSGLSGPPLGIQHLGWALDSVGARGELLDLNISYSKELVCDSNVDRALDGAGSDTARELKLRSLRKIAENDRLRFSRAFDAVLPTDPEMHDGVAYSEEEQLAMFESSDSFRLLMNILTNGTVRLVGLSILSFSQVPYAKAIARVVKKRTSATVVFGGSEITGWPVDRLESFASESFVDAIVLGDGERAIRDLWSAPSPPIKKIVRGEPMPLVDIPISASFRIRPHVYLAPSYLNLVESKGCYWNRCTHCDYIALNDKLDLGRDIGELVDAMDAEFARSGVQSFHLVNETLTPSRARKLAEEVSRRRTSIRWNSFVKIDRRFSTDILRLLPDGGCEYLVIGLESLSAKGLEVLDKGYTAAEALNWIREARSCGVSLVLNFIVGIPGTTMEDDMETLERLAEFPDLATRSKVYSFVLSRLSEMGRRPEAFGLEVRAGNVSSHGHRGGSSMQFVPADDLRDRLRAFKEGLQKLAARARLSGPLAQFLLSAKFDLAIRPTTLAVSRSISVGLIDRGHGRRCEIYDYRNGTTLSIDASHFEVALEAVQQRRFDAERFVRSGATAERLEVLQHMGEAGFLRAASP